MNRLIRALLFVGLLPVSSTWACTCAYVPPTFCETMGPDWIGAPDLIVLAVKLNDVDHGMDVEVAQVIAGPAQPGDVLRVWGDNGNCCRVYTSIWSVGDTVLLALMPTDLMGNFFGPDLEQVGDLMIFNCGTYYLDFSEGMVQGPVAPGVAQVPMSGLPSYLQGCDATGVHVEGAQPPMRVEWIGDHIFVHPPPGARRTELEVVDLQGRAVLNRRTSGEPVQVNVSLLPPGCYVFRLWADGTVFSRQYILP